MSFFRPTEGARTVAEFSVDGEPVASFAEVEYPPPMIRSALRCRTLQENVLSGPKLKLRRAKEHIREAEKLCRDYGASQPFVDGQRFNSDGVEVIWLSLRMPPPPQISAVVGDAVHGLRSALDWLACELARANAQKPLANTGYPTSDVALASLAKLLSPKAIAMLSKVRRAKRWNEALWILHKLDIQDKHDRILTTAAATLSVETTASLPMFSLTPSGSIAIGAAPLGSTPFPGTRGRRRGLPSVLLNESESEIYRFNPNFREAVDYEVDLVFAEGEAEGEPVLKLLNLFACGVERMLVLAERRLF